MKRLLPLVAVGLLAVELTAQQVALAREDYIEPPDPVLGVLTSEAMTGQVALRNLGPDGSHFVVGVSGGMTPLEMFARPYVNLGEMALDHRANRSRRMSTSNTVGYHLVDARTGAATPIQVPKGTTVSGASWSPDGERVAFMVHHAKQSTLWVADAESGATRQVAEAALNATMVTGFQWTGDSKHLVAALVPKGRGPMPQPGAVAETPQVRMTRAGEAPTRTYRFLLKTPHDMRLLEYLITSQLAVITVENGQVRSVGQPAMITRVDAAPDGKHFRVTTMRKPFSYFVPARSFGTVEELWDLDGKVLATLAERELREPGQGRGDDDDEEDEEEPKRGMTWAADGRSLMFLQREPKPKKPVADKGDKKDNAKDDGDKMDKPKDDDKGKGKGKDDDKNKDKPKGDDKDKKDQDPDGDDESKKKKSKPKDRVMLWSPPFKDGAAKELWASEETISSVRTSDDGRMLFVRQTIDKKSQIRAINLRKPGEPILIHEAKPEAGAAPAGRPRGFGGGVDVLTGRGSKGRSVVVLTKDRKAVYLRGTDRPEEDERDTMSARPWIDRLELGAEKPERLWQAEGEGVLESFVALADHEASGVFFTRESATDVPDTFRVDLESGEEVQLTNNVDPAPDVTHAERVRFQVTRVDGFKFWVSATIPRNYGKELPALFWFYPREFANQEAYDRGVRAPDPNRFPMMRRTSKDLLTMHGYVVVTPDCPIVGEDGRMNDNYVGDLRNSLWAAIDELDRREIIDRSRLAIGGHSYGAFGTANAMVHTPFFKAGIAGDGNYNRTLTPMAFQSERRYLWDAREVYMRMSPLLWAEQLNGALLMYHGMDDNNVGTFPIHAPRMFQALDGLGKPASLYMYPYEGHGPTARETILDLWGRWIHWLDKYVKNAGEEAAEVEAEADDGPSTNEGR